MGGWRWVGGGRGVLRYVSMVHLSVRGFGFMGLGV